MDEIDLSGCPVSEAGLRALEAFPSLHNILLAETPIRDELCAAIPKVKGLTLNLSRTGLTDACISGLFPTTFLEVNLDETGLSDAGLLAIAEDDGVLSTLCVRGTKVTAKGIVDCHEKFAERGRNCRIVHDFPPEEIDALHDARRASRAAQAESPVISANPE
jgi:hypothetical protein